jgi:hypothetical protein
VGHPIVENHTRFHFQALFLADEAGQPLLVPVVKASFSIGKDGSLAVADDQVPLCLAGEMWGDPESSSYKYEPECAFMKPATDVVLIGHAEPDRVGATEVNVGFGVGNLSKVARVIGDRVWERSLGRISASKPRILERVPLIWERSFGGWDRTDPERAKHTFEPRNPVGRGFHGKGGRFIEGIPLPNLEDPRQPIHAFGDAPPPIGFGFVSPHWKPRCDLAGTYDAAWEKTRRPLLPADFNRRFFNAAPSGLVAAGHLRGDEPVVVVNVGQAKTTLRLPGVPPPEARVNRKGRKEEVLGMALDTVIVNLDERILLLLWRAHLALRTGPEEVLSVEVADVSAAGARMS